MIVSDASHHVGNFIKTCSVFPKAFLQGGTIHDKYCTLLLPNVNYIVALHVFGGEGLCWCGYSVVMKLVGGNFIVWSVGFTT